MTSNDPLMTVAELLRLPDDGKTRELVRGRLFVRDGFLKGYRHASVCATLITLLKTWAAGDASRGDVLAGGVCFRLGRDPDTTVTLDVACLSAALLAAAPHDAVVIDGLPTLAVDILSPQDDQEETATRVSACLAAGVPLVWVVEPVFQTVTVYRPDAPPAMFNVAQQLDGGPHLPGFRADVAEVFAD